jgi:NADH-quinone oxidoreductase subunit D
MNFDWSSTNREQLQAHRALLSTFAEQALATLTQINATAGPIDVTLPKVVRVPVGQSYQLCRATTGTVGVWLHSDGGKSPLRVALTSPSLLALGTWQETSRGKSLENALGDLFALPLCYGEIER